jgi:hypothetical protein
MEKEDIPQAFPNNGPTNGSTPESNDKHLFYGIFPTKITYPVVDDTYNIYAQNRKVDGY